MLIFQKKKKMGKREKKYRPIASIRLINRISFHKSINYYEKKKENEFPLLKSYDQ